MRVRPHIPFLSSSRIHLQNAVRVIRCTRRTGDALDHRRCSARCSSRTRRRPWYAQVHQGVLRQRVGYSQMMRARRPSVSVDLHCPAVLRSRLQLEGGTAVELSSRLFAHTHMRRHPPRTSSGWHSPLRQCIIFGGSRGAETAIDTEYNQLRVEEALVRSQRAAKLLRADFDCRLVEM